jgi:hypothetical protein
MDLHGLETILATQVVRVLRFLLGFRRDDPSDRFQLGRAHRLQVLPWCG